MKRKTMTLVLCLLAALALVSVGFASWVISADATGDATGNITVDTVSDHRLSVQAEVNTSFVFGKYHGETTPTHSWLSNNGDQNEVLTATIKVTLTKTASNTATDWYQNLTIEGLLEGVDLSDGKDIFDLTYGTDNKTFIQHVASNEFKYGAFKLDETDHTKATGTVTVSINWGTLFNGQNPYLYYNNQAYTEALGDEALKVLGDFHEKLDNAQFKVTLTVKTK